MSNGDALSVAAGIFASLVFIVYLHFVSNKDND